MKILITSDGYIVKTASLIAFGQWEEADKVNGVIVHKWKAEDENGNILCYYLDENQKSIDGTEPPTLTVHEVDEFPEGYDTGKYLFINGEFVENPDWSEPPKSDAERIAELEEEVDDLTEYQAELLFELSLMQLGLTNDDL